jgi:spore coat protein U-like protein
MFKRFGTLTAALLIASGALTGSALAGSQTATVTVNGSVSQSCTAFTPTSDTLSFPAYDSFANASTPLDASNNLDFTTSCTKGASNVTFTVNGGSNYANATTSGDRAMKSGSNYLDYNLYQDSPGGTLWGFNTSTGAGTAVALGTITSSGTVQHLKIYGREPAGQDPAVGASYSDTVTIAVNY